jgi:predicted nucleic acid-binding protein
MPLVVDVSVMAAWHFPDERSPEADAIRAKLRDDEVVVPGLWWFELRNVLLTGERRRRATPETTAAFLDDLRALSISIALLPDENAVMDLARRHRLSFYDASYLELAQREALPLATFDGDLIVAAKAEGVALVATT